MATAQFFAKIRGWGEGVLAGRMNEVKAALIDRWLDLAGTLNTTLLDYQQAMDVRSEDNGKTLVFALADTPKMAQLVEFGMVPFDMRQTLLQATSRSVRVSRTGALYMYVPLRKTTRQIIDMGSNAAYKAARALNAYAPGGGADRLPSGMAEKLDPYHAADPLAGLVRLAPAPGSKRGSTYMTWRTISQNGRPWIHRGIQSRNFMRQVLEHESSQIVTRVLLGGR